MEIDLVRLVLAIQAMIAGDPAPLAAFEELGPEYRELVLVEPVPEPYWTMHGEIISNDLANWALEWREKPGVRAFLAVRREPLFLDRFDDIPMLLDRGTGFGPEGTSVVLCLESDIERAAFWLADERPGDARRLSLWRLPEWPADCERHRPAPDEAWTALDGALELMTDYTAEVFGTDSFWLEDSFRPHRALLHSDGRGRSLFDGLVEPGERKALLEASYGLNLGGGMGSWSDHYPPEGFEGKYQQALEAWREAADMAALAAVNTLAPG